MKSIAFQTLVRDKVPEMIRASGGVPQWRVLEDEEYLAELKKKMIDIAWDVFHSDTEKMQDALAELLEVTTWTMKTAGFEPKDVFRLAEEKREARGGFGERMYLVSVEEVEQVG